MSSKSRLLDMQRSWASKLGAVVDHRNYFSSVAANLHAPLSKRASRAFSMGSGSELRDTASRPAKMKALHSSSALAVNVFDYWTERNPSPLLAALELSLTAASIDFEAQFPTGLDGKPPNLDIGLRLDSGKIVGVESKFSEWLSPKSPNKAPFKPKYFADSAQHWSTAGLVACQVLAEEMRSGARHFRYLDAPQLLKHALGLATQHRGNFDLYYVYYDFSGPETVPHRAELEEFEALVRSDFRFRWISYQDVYSRLVRLIGPENAAYTNYLRERYFLNAV